MSNANDNIKCMANYSLKLLVALMNIIFCICVPYYGTYLLVKKTDLTNKFLCMLALISVLVYTLNIITLVVSLFLHNDSFIHILGQFFKDMAALSMVGLFLWTIISVITFIVTSIIND